MKTKNITLVLTCGVLAALGAMSLQGCSSSDDTTGTAGTGGTSSGGKGGAATTGGTSSGGKGGSGTAGTGTAGTGTGGTGNQAGATGSEAGAAGAAPVTQADLCDEFCADEMVTCTDALLQYTTVGECTLACSQFTLGMPDDAGGQNTLYCRIYHLGVAAMSAALASAHCAHTKADPAPNTPCAGP